MTLQARQDTKGVVAIIPARGGSKGLPGKNLRLFHGKPLIAHAIEAAKSTPLIHRIIVSTDDPEIAEVSRSWGAETPFMRPADLSTDLATTEAVLRHAVEWLETREGYHVNIVVFLTCNHVFRKREWVHEVVKRLLADESLDTVFLAYATRKNFWRRIGGRYVRLAPDIPYASRQVREPLYREDTPIACATRADVVRQGKRVGDNVDIVVTDDDRTSIDIQDEFSLWLADKIMAERPMQE